MIRSLTISMCSALALAACSGDRADPPPAPRGASVPWIEYEAEAGQATGGATLEQTTSGPWLEGTLSGEASGRRAVTLHGPGDAVQWTSRGAANSIVVRASVPDETEAHLDVLVNDAKVATLTVNAEFSWLYTGPTNDETHNAYPLDTVRALPQTPSPSDVGFGLVLPFARPHHLYDEAHALLAADGAAVIHAGDAVKLVATDASAQVPVTVDFIDLELVPAPLQAPADLVPVAGRDRPAVEAALAAAVAQGKRGIFLPPGEYVLAHGAAQDPLTIGTAAERRAYLQATKIHVPAGLTVQGAGLWHTRFVAPPPAQVGYNYELGFQLDGDGVAFSDFAVFGSWRNRAARFDTQYSAQGWWPWLSYDGFGRAFDGYMHHGARFQRLWIERTIVGGWVEGGDDMLWEDCRIRNTMADGINLCNGTTRSRIVNCTARNVGDDAFAMWSAMTPGRTPNTETPWVIQPEGPDQLNVIERCTAGLVWRAAGFAVYGGHDNVIRDSVVYDTLRYPGVTVDNEFAPQHEFSGTTTIQNLTVERCGGHMWWDDDGPKGDEAQRRTWGAVWLFAANPHDPAEPSSPIRFQGIRLKDIDIVDPVYSGVLVQATQGQEIADTELDGVHVVMNASGEYGMVANDSHKAPPSGSPDADGNRVPVPTVGSIVVRNSSITGSRVTSGNLFQKDEASAGTFTFVDGGGNGWRGDR